MATHNSWNNQILAADSAITLNSGSNNINISTDAAETNVHIADSASTRKYVTMGSSIDDSSTGISAGTGGISCVATNGPVTVNSGTGTISVGTSATNSTINLATGAAVKTLTVGSTNSTSTTTVQSGSGGLTVTSTNGALTINSGTGALGVSTDASATTVNLATGAGVKTLTVGSTNTTSSTAIKSGTGNIINNTGLTIDSIGRSYNTKQPAFAAYNSTQRNNVTGNGTIYTLVFDTEIFDQNNNFDGTSTFTASVTGKYHFTFGVWYKGLAVTNTYLGQDFITSNRSWFGLVFDVGGGFTGDNNYSTSYFVDMDAGDTAYCRTAVNGGTQVVDVFGAGDPYTWFSGYLVC